MLIHFAPEFMLAFALSLVFASIAALEVMQPSPAMSEHLSRASSFVRIRAPSFYPSSPPHPPLFLCRLPAFPPGPHDTQPAPALVAREPFLRSKLVQFERYRDKLDQFKRYRDNLTNLNNLKIRCSQNIVFYGIFEATFFQINQMTQINQIS